MSASLNNVVSDVFFKLFIFVAQKRDINIKNIYIFIFFLETELTFHLLECYVILKKNTFSKI